MWLAPVIGGTAYAVTAVVLTRNPHLLPAFVKNRRGWSKSRKSKDNGNGDEKKPARLSSTNCVHISHRGGAGEFYENTLKAFRESVALGTQMIELDVHLTKDDVVVVSHDQNLLRATGHNLKIKETDFQDLPPLRHAIPLDFVYQQKFSSDDKDSDHIRIAKLEDVFKAFPDTSINIDIKTYDEKLIAEVDALIRRYDRSHNCVWGNFSDKTTSKCYQVNPETGLLFSFKEVLKLLLLFYSGLLPFMTFRETHLEIPMPLSLKYKLGAEITLKQKILLHMADWLLMRRWLFEHLKARGIPTYVWVLNSEEEFDRAFNDLNVSGVMTDYPSLLKDYLKRHPNLGRSS